MNNRQAPGLFRNWVFRRFLFFFFSNIFAINKLEGYFCNNQHYGNRAIFFLPKIPDRKFQNELITVLLLLVSSFPAWAQEIPTSPHAVPQILNFRIADQSGHPRLIFDLTGPINFIYGPTIEQNILMLELRGARWELPVNRHSVHNSLVTETIYQPLSTRSGRLFITTRNRARLAHITTYNPMQTGGPWRLVIDLRAAVGIVTPMSSARWRAERPYAFVNWRQRAHLVQVEKQRNIGQNGRFVLHRTLSYGTGQTRAIRQELPDLAGNIPGTLSSASNPPPPGLIIPDPRHFIPPPG